MPLNSLIQKRKYSLKRSAKVFFEVKELLIRKKKKICVSTYESIKRLLLKLEAAIEDKDGAGAYALRQKILKEAQEKLKKNTWDYFNEWFIGIGAILLTVALINQLWFQLYQIPTGSMRPTLMEKDRLVATKTNFGINLPFKSGHLHFNPKQLKRGNIVILQNDDLPKKDNTSRYLFIFPAQKQFVKRLIGKPGDILYFYGGKIYGLDRDNQEIKDFQNSPAFESLEHIPFNSFEGKVLSESKAEASQIHSPVYLYQVGQLIGKLYLNSSGSFQGKFYNGSQWVDESPQLSYQDLWGIRNYSMLRMLTKEESLKAGAPSQDSDTPYLLEISHSPHLNFPRPHLGMDLEGRLRPKLSLEKSYISLNAEHLKKIKDALTTSRFVIKNEQAGNYSMEKNFKPNAYSPSFKGVPNGTYEFIKGVGYQVDSTGQQHRLRDDHPLNSSEPQIIQKLFNLGMQMLTLYEPSQQHFDFIPRRYGYFRHGDFYIMGEPVFKANDTVLAKFNEQERQKTHGFIDQGPPLLPDGTINKEQIINYGLYVPKGHYLLLGDNHAGSRDCRSWGFIPEKNLQGSPSIIIWPPSVRFGKLSQNHLTWLNGPTLLMTLLGSSLILGSSFLNRKQKKKKL